MIYSSIFAAVMAVLPGVPHDGHEYAGAVIRHNNGTYEVSGIAAGSGDSFQLEIRIHKGDTIVAVFHNHPPGFDSDRPSNNDREVARRLAVRSYIRIDATDEIKVIE